jgi:hypothetical protein
LSCPQFKHPRMGAVYEQPDPGAVDGRKGP